MYVALVIQHATRMRHIAIRGLASLYYIFPHYLINGTIFGKKVTEHKMCNNKQILCITHTVEHNYISLSSTVGIQLHVSALYVGHLQVVI